MERLEKLLAKKKFGKNNGIFLPLVLPVLLVVIWKSGCDANLINTSLLPSPDHVITALVTMLGDGSLKKHVIMSTTRVFEGYAVGVTLGLLLGILAGLFKPVYQLLSSLIGMFRPIPAIAMIPFLILWFGIDETPKIIVIAIGSFWPVLLNTIQGIKSADTKLLELARVLEKNQLVVLIRIILPAALPSIFTGMRLGISHAWACVVAAEMIASAVGVGFLISYARELLQPDVLFVGVASIGLIGWAIDIVMLQLQKWVLYWHVSEETTK